MSGGVRYHVGFLMRDREFNDDAKVMQQKMLRLFKDGAVHLVQKRLMPGVYEYWAIPRKVCDARDQL
jgi:hypothetical protein